MNVEKAYNQWSGTYDQMANKTRDLEGVALREILAEIQFESVLEIGCGTGKNTEWLVEKALKIVAVDLSGEMLEKAAAKIKAQNVEFIRADINEIWTFAKQKYDLVGFSLVLEHIKDLKSIFQKVNQVLMPKGYLYIGELHPFKQYTGTKARFETENGLQIVDCFDHHISDFVQNGLAQGFQLIELREYFDENDRTALPRIVGMLFQK